MSIIYILHLKTLPPLTRFRASKALIMDCTLMTFFTCSSYNLKAIDSTCLSQCV